MNLRKRHLVIIDVAYLPVGGYVASMRGYYIEIFNLSHAII